MEVKLEPVKFVVHETPYVCWDLELTRKNLEFLEGIDSEYFRYVADMNVAHLESDDKHRAALALRLAYSQGLETLFALLCAMIQAPQCVIGWMLSYQNEHLETLVTNITMQSPVHSRLRGKRIGWKSLAKYVHAGVGKTPEEARWIQEGFGSLWVSFAGDFANDKFKEEYNNVKHGLRTRPGGYSLAFGLEEQEGIPASPERMQTIASSNFGSSYFTKERINNNRINFYINEHSINWNPISLCHRLQFLSMSINNVVSRLRLLNGASVSTCNFKYPRTREVFDVVLRNVVNESSFGIEYQVSYRQSTLLTKEDVIQSYSEIF